MRRQRISFKSGDLALSRDGHPVKIERIYYEEGTAFAVVRYLDGHLPYAVGGRVAGTEEAPLWEHRVKSGKVVRSGGDYWNDADWEVEKGLRRLDSAPDYEAADPAGREASTSRPTGSVGTGPTDTPNKGAYMARKTDNTSTTRKAEAKTEAPALNLQKLLLDGLAAEGVKPKVRKAPSGGYVSLLVSDRNVAYVSKQTAKGMKVEPALSLEELPKSVKGFGANKSKSDRFLLGQVTDAKGVAHAVEAIKLAAAKAKEQGKAKAKPAPKPRAERPSEAAMGEAEQHEAPAADVADALLGTELPAEAEAEAKEVQA